jgi:hypothetical protein
MKAPVVRTMAPSFTHQRQSEAMLRLRSRTARRM